jgi:hypothetical protein
MRRRNLIYRMTAAYAAGLREHFVASGDNETQAFALCSYGRGHSCELLICKDLILPDAGEVEAQSPVSIAPTVRHQAHVYWIAAEKGLIVVDIHNHPFTQNAWFSSIDMAKGRENALYLAKKLRTRIPMGMIVFSRNMETFQGQVWNRSTERFDEIQRVEFLGATSTILIKETQACL